MPDASDAESTQQPLLESRLLHGDLRRQVFWLALPVLAEQLLNYAVGLTDTFLSGRISADATAAVGIGAYVNWLVEIIFAVIGTGTSALVARHWGAGERAAANRIAGCALALAVVLGVIAAGVLYVFAPAFGAALGLVPAVNEVTTRFLRISCVGHLFSSICFIGGSVLRGSGQMRVPMAVLGCVSVLNVLLTSMLVFGVPYLTSGWGVDGIATGTVIARCFGAVLMSVVLASGMTELRAFPNWRSLWDWESVRRILRIGAPAACDGLLMWLGHMTFVRIIASFGSKADSNVALAAHMVFIEVEAVTYLPAWAWGTAAATMIGQCLGANLPDRARRSAHAAVQQACVLATVVMLLFFFASGPIYSLMHRDPAVGALGAPALAALAWMEIPLVIAIVYTASIRGAGDTFAPLVINAACVFGIRLTVGALGAIVFDGGLFGAWCGMAVDVSVRAIVFSIYFRRGRWSQPIAKSNEASR